MCVHVDMHVHVSLGSGLKSSGVYGFEEATTVRG